MSVIARCLMSGTALSVALAGAASAQIATDERNAYRYGTVPGMFVNFIPLAMMVAIAMGSAGSASAQTNEGSVFSAANIASGLVRVGVTYGRFVSDIRYDSMEVDPKRGALTLRGLQIDGLGDASECHVELGKLEMSGITFWGAEEMRSRFEASDLAIATNCFGPNAAMIGMVTGGPTIPLDSLVIDAHQVSGSGSASIGFEAVSPGIARIEGSADFDYVSVIMPQIIQELSGGRDPMQDLGFDENGNLIDPVETPEAGMRGLLNAAHVSVENLGVWERLQPILPPDAISPEATQMVVTAESGSAMRAVQEDLAEALVGFLENPGRVTAEIRAAEPIAFDTTEWVDEEDAVAVFAPVFSNSVPTPPVSLIASPDGDDPLVLGLALAEGRGLPQNSRRAIELLSPLEDSAEAMLAVAHLTAETDPAAAYGFAQRAAGLGDTAAPAALDRLEGQMETADLLSAQADSDGQIPEESFASVTALRDAALAYAEGDGVARSYEIARRLAGSAAAAGDGMAQSLIARLDTRFAGDPAWIEARNTAADLAMEDWTGQDLASRFAGQ